jgi:hypothetical protein
MRVAKSPSSAYSEPRTVRRTFLTECGTTFIKPFRVIIVAPFLVFLWRPGLFDENPRLNQPQSDSYS